MQLPRTDKMPQLHSEQLSPEIRACILDADVSKLLALSAADAALCAVTPRLIKVAPGPQYCWVCVTSPKIEAGVCDLCLFISSSLVLVMWSKHFWGVSADHAAYTNSSTLDAVVSSPALGTQLCKCVYSRG